jgi:hypothetical protein
MTRISLILSILHRLSLAPSSSPYIINAQANRSNTSYYRIILLDGPARANFYFKIGQSVDDPIYSPLYRAIVKSKIIGALGKAGYLHHSLVIYLNLNTRDNANKDRYERVGDGIS